MKKTNFQKLVYKTTDIIEDFIEAAKSEESSITQKDISDINKIIYGTYRLIAVCLLNMKIDDALKIIYSSGSCLPTIETITRTARRKGIKVKKAKENIEIRETIKRTIENNARLKNGDINGELFSAVYREIIKDYDELTFGEFLLMEKLPSFESVSRTMRTIRKSG